MTVAVTINSTPVVVSLVNQQIAVTLSGFGPQGATGPQGPAGSSLPTLEISTATQLMPSVNYITNNASRVVGTLPAAIAQGQTVSVAGKGQGGWTLSQNAGQTIHVEGMQTTTGVAGYLQSQAYTDSVTLTCITADTDFLVTSLTGSILGN